MIRIAEHVLKPAIRNRLDKLDQAGWKDLNEKLKGIWEGSERLLYQFGHRLEPVQHEILMDIQQSVRSALIFYTTFPEMAGVPEEKLPETKTPPEILKRHGYDTTGKDVENLLRLSSLLLRD